MADDKNVKVRDLTPEKDAKGGGKRGNKRGGGTSTSNQ